MRTERREYSRFRSVDAAGWKACDLSACNRSFVQTKHPRSAVALMKDGTVFLIAVAGRFEGKAEGINIPELTHLLRVLGGPKKL